MLNYNPAETLFNELILPKIRTYRIPYMGSKNQIASQIIEYILNSTKAHKEKRFVDAFCGGGSVAYGVYATKMFGEVYATDIHSELVELHRNLPELDLMYIAKTPCLLRPNKEVQEKYPFVKMIDEIEPKYQMAFRIVYSFGNNYRTNLWGNKMIKKYELAYYLFHDTDKMGGVISEFIGADAVINFEYKAKDISKVYSEYKRHIGLYRSKFGDKKDIEQLGQLERLQNLERLGRLQNLQQLQNLQHGIRFETKSYKDLEYKPSDIIYFDPPYRNTGGYHSNSFDNDEFEEFARGLSQPVFISEYQPKIKGFEPILEIPKRQTMSPTSNNLVTEFLHWNGK